MTDDFNITPEIILNAYANGLFPMADSANSNDVHWYDPLLRGQLSIAKLHVPRRLRKTISKHPYEITLDRAFVDVIKGCAKPTKQRPTTWINQEIIDLFTELHDLGFAHSVEAWDRDTGALVGGVYGIALGGVFFGESMFSNATDASKIALVSLIAHLWKQGYELFDTQYTNDHLKQFGVYEVPQHIYKQQLDNVIKKDVGFYSEASGGGVSTVTVLDLSLVLEFLQSISQTSKIG